MSAHTHQLTLRSVQEARGSGLESSGDEMWSPHDVNLALDDLRKNC